MDSKLPLTAFIDPRGNNRKEVEALVRRVLDLVIDHIAGAAERPPFPDNDALPVSAAIPESPASDDVLLSHIKMLLEASLNDATPNYIAHMDSLSTTLSALGDFISAAAANNMLSREMSPAFPRLEDALMKEFTRLFGLGDQSGGVMSSGGGLSNLLSLAVARNTLLGTLEGSVHGLEKRPVLFASEAAHASIKKSAMIMDLGTEAVIPITINAAAKMDPDDLRRKIEQAKAEGKHPFCVVATAGTTSTGNIDPLVEIGRVAREHGLWFHVDAVWGGGLQFSDQHRKKLRGIKQADSVSFNPQKMLLVARTCSMALFRDFDAMKRHFRVRYPYMSSGEDFTNLGEIGLQGSRPTEVLKLWLSLQHIGRKAYGELVDQRIALVEFFARKIKQRPVFQLAAKPESGIVCFRGTPGWLPESEWEAWNTELQARLLREKKIYVSSQVIRGQKWLRVVLLNPYTAEGVFDSVLELADNYIEETYQATVRS